MTPFERACRSLCLSDGLDPDRKYKSSDYGEDNAPYEYAWHEYQRNARAMLIALRVPCEEMIDAVDDGFGPPAEYLTKIWKAMIDELLKQCDDIR